MKAAVVFGGKSWIALAIAREFAANGHNIYLVARDCEALRADEPDFRIRYNVDVTLVEMDILDEPRLAEFVEEFAADCPDVVISVLGRQEEADRERADVDYIDGLVRGNLFGPAMVLEKFATLMEKAGRGTLIGISSVAGDRGRQKNYTYGATKAGFTAFLSGLRNRLFKAGVHVITVKPGVIETPGTVGMGHPAALMGKPETVGADVYKAFAKGRNTIYTPWFWRWIMLIIRLIPEAVFKRLDI